MDLHRHIKLGCHDAVCTSPMDVCPAGSHKTEALIDINIPTRTKSPYWIDGATQSTFLGHQLGKLGTNICMHSHKHHTWHLLCSQQRPSRQGLIFCSRRLVIPVSGSLSRRAWGGLVTRQMLVAVFVHVFHVSIFGQFCSLRYCFYSCSS
jgi:hypothetical protein